MHVCCVILIKYEYDGLTGWIDNRLRTLAYCRQETRQEVETSLACSNHSKPYRRRMASIISIILMVRTRSSDFSHISAFGVSIRHTVLERLIGLLRSHWYDFASFDFAVNYRL